VKIQCISGLPVFALKQRAFSDYPETLGIGGETLGFSLESPGIEV
jgi:hypothetical protein